jgi:hypothetical protein
MEYGFLSWHSPAAPKQSFLTSETAAAFVLHLFPFGVSRRGGIGRSMFDVHSFLSFLFDQTGRFGGQRPS